MKFLSLNIIFQLSVIIVCQNTTTQNNETEWACDHQIFCKPYEGILHTIQTAGLFKVEFRVTCYNKVF